MDTDIYMLLFGNIRMTDNQKCSIIKRSNEMHHDDACSHQANCRICD